MALHSLSELPTSAAAAVDDGNSGGQTADANRPVLSAYKSFCRSTPTVTRWLVQLLAASYLLSLLVGAPSLSAALANVPARTLNGMQLHRVFTSVLICPSLLGLIFAGAWVSDVGGRMEQRMGSATYLGTLIALTAAGNVLYLALNVLPGPGAGAAPLPTEAETVDAGADAGAAGVWPLLLALIALECGGAPAGSTRPVLPPHPARVPVRLYPLILLSLFALLGLGLGGSLDATALGVTAGYAFAWQCGCGGAGGAIGAAWRERLVFWEGRGGGGGGFLAALARCDGWVPCHASTVTGGIGSGRGTWSDLPTAQGDAGRRGGLSSMLHTLRQRATAHRAGDSGIDGEGMMYESASEASLLAVVPTGFPDSGGRTLGGEGGGGGGGGGYGERDREGGAHHAAIAAERRAAEAAARLRRENAMSAGDGSGTGMVGADVA